jgi:hypothetical protein
MVAKVAAFYASKGYDTEGRTDVKTDERVRFLGTYKQTTFEAEDMSILFFGASNKLYYPKSNVSIGAQRAYFKLGDGDGLAHPLMDFTINFGDGETATGIIGIGSTRTDTDKNDGYWYDLQGRKLSGKPTQKGIYINHGNKVVIK